MARWRRLTNHPFPRAEGGCDQWLAHQLACWSSPLRGTGWPGASGATSPHPIPAWTLSAEEQRFLAEAVALITSGPASTSTADPDRESLYAGVRFSDPSQSWENPQWTSDQLTWPATARSPIPTTAAAIWPQFIVYAGVLHRYDSDDIGAPHPTWVDDDAHLEAWLLESALRAGQGVWYSGTRLQGETHLSADLRARLRRWRPDAGF